MSCKRANKMSVPLYESGSGIAHVSVAALLKAAYGLESLEHWDRGFESRSKNGFISHVSDVLPCVGRYITMGRLRLRTRTKLSKMAS
jgi:hypothetical protein